MGSFGRQLVRGLAGAANGYGQYLIGEGQARQRSAEADALLLREQALARFRAGLESTAADEQLGRAMKLGSHNAGEARVSTRLELNQRGEIATAAQANENNENDRRAMRDFRLWMQREGIQQDNAMARMRYAQDINPTRRIEWITRDDGMRVGYDIDTGETIDTGVPVRETATPSLFPEPGGGAPPRRAAPARTAPAPARPAARAPGGNTYTEADLLATMRANRLSRSAAIRQIEARGYRRAQ